MIIPLCKFSLMIISQSKLFFNDFILILNSDEECIVDVIDVADGSKIPLANCINKFLVKIDPIDLLKDPEVFLKAIEVCEKARFNEINKK